LYRSTCAREMEEHETNAALTIEYVSESRIALSNAFRNSMEMRDQYMPTHRTTIYVAAVILGITYRHIFYLK
jgi:hypothetical protein